VAQYDLISPVNFSQYVNDMPTTSHLVKIVFYTDETAIISTSCNPTLLVIYLESYLKHLQRWLSERRIAMNVSKITVICFARGRRHSILP
jgi:hypothetical protein